MRPPFVKSPTPPRSGRCAFCRVAGPGAVGTRGGVLTCCPGAGGPRPWRPQTRLAAGSPRAGRVQSPAAVRSLRPRQTAVPSSRPLHQRGCPQAGLPGRSGVGGGAAHGTRAATIAGYAAREGMAMPRGGRRARWPGPGGFARRASSWGPAYPITGFYSCDLFGSPFNHHSVGDGALRCTQLTQVPIRQGEVQPSPGR
jgi:hypothetical protein